MSKYSRSAKHKVEGHGYFRKNKAVRGLAAGIVLAGGVLAYDGATSANAAYADEIVATTAVAEQPAAEVPVETAATPVEQPLLDGEGTVYTEPTSELVTPEVPVSHATLDNAIVTYEKTVNIVETAEPVVHTVAAVEETNQALTEIEADYQKQAQAIKAASDAYNKELADKKAAIEAENAKIAAENAQKKADYDAAEKQYQENLKKREAEIAEIESKPIIEQGDGWNLRGEYNTSATNYEYYKGVQIQTDDGLEIAKISVPSAARLESGATVIDKNGNDVTAERRLVHIVGPNGNDANAGSFAGYGYAGKESLNSIVGDKYIFQNIGTNSSGQPIGVQMELLGFSSPEAVRSSEANSNWNVYEDGDKGFKVYGDKNLRRGALEINGRGMVDARYTLIDAEGKPLGDDVITVIPFYDLDYGQMVEFSDNVVMIMNDAGHLTPIGENGAIGSHQNENGEWVGTPATNSDTVEGSMILVVKGSTFDVKFGSTSRLDGSYDPKDAVYDANQTENTGSGAWVYQIFGNVGDVKVLTVAEKPNEPTYKPLKSTNVTANKRTVNVKHHDIDVVTKTHFIDEKGQPVADVVSGVSTFKEQDGYTFVRTVQDEHGNVVHVYHKVQTSHVDTKGKELKPTVDGTHPKAEIEKHVFVETKVEKNGDTVHVYRPVVTTFVDQAGKDVAPQVDGTEPKVDVDGYVFVETRVKDNGDIEHVYREVITNFVDQNGNEVASSLDGKQPNKAIDGYVFVETTVDPETGDTTHVYRQVTTSFVDANGNPLSPTVNGATGAIEIPGYVFVGTEVDPETGDVKHIYASVAATPAQPAAPVATVAQATPRRSEASQATSATTYTQNTLPETGDAGSVMAVAGTALSILGLAGVTGRKRK